MAPAVLTDPARNNMSYYVDASGNKHYAVNGAWVPEAQAFPPEPTPVPVPTVIPQPIAVPNITPQPLTITPANPAPMTVPGQAPTLSQNISGMMAVGGGMIDFASMDLTGVNDASWKVIPDGAFVIWNVDKCEVANSKGDGGQMLKLTLSCVDVFHAMITDSSQYKGAKCFDYIKADEDSKWKMKRLARMTGFLSPDERRITATSHTQFEGHQIGAYVKVEQYNGRDSNKIAGTYELPQKPDIIPTSNGQASAVPTAAMPAMPAMPSAPAATNPASVVAPPQAAPGPVAFPPMPGQPIAVQEAVSVAMTPAAPVQ